MTIHVTFHIGVCAWKTGTVYRMLVEHYYSSAQVERFRIKGKSGRVILLEKKLLVHKQPWKIIDGDITTTNIEQSSMAIRDTQDCIDDYLRYRNSYPLNEGHVTMEDMRNEFQKKIKKY